MPKGVYLRTPEIKSNLKNTFKCGHKIWVGRSHSQESKNKMSSTMMGRSSPNKGKKLSQEIRDKLSAAHGGDGFKRHYLMQSHAHMMRRCYDITNNRYSHYGFEGIDVWNVWHNRKLFILGIECILGPRPEGYSLDRINPHRGYCEYNVRWADHETQAINKRYRVLDYCHQPGDH
jgi:hypothetical protein